METMGCGRETKRRRAEPDAHGSREMVEEASGASTHGVEEASGGTTHHHGTYEESADAWEAWEEEMKEYPGWEDGGGACVIHTKHGTVEPGDGSAAAMDQLTGQLLEDMENRVKILAVMADAGMHPETMRQIFESHVRAFTLDARGAKGEGGEAPGGRRVYLAHDEDRNLHVTVFGWGRFRWGNL
jgi:hypothetical protein